MSRPPRAWLLAERAPAIVLGRGQRGLPLRSSPLPLRQRASGGGAVLPCAGTLLAPPPWRLLCDALGQPRGEAERLAATTVSLAECLPQAADPRRLASALAAALATLPPQADQGNRAASPAASTAPANRSNSELLSRKHAAPRPR